MKKNVVIALVVFLATGLYCCAPQKDAKNDCCNVKREAFQKNIDGKRTDLFIIKNQNGMCCAITNYGAKIVGLCVPDKNNQMADVVLGFSSIDEWRRRE